MIGAIIGDIVGSRFEFIAFKSKDFELFDKRCFFTDDTVMTLACAKAIIEYKKDGGNLNELASFYMRDIGRHYPHCGYGGRFRRWMFSDGMGPYGSFGNGSAMRVSAAGFAANSIEEAKYLSKCITKVTHNHKEGIKGAEAVAVCIFLARNGKSKEEIRKYVEDNYYPLDFTIDEIRPSYRFNEICQDTVPQAIECFLEADSFEETIRNAISLGGDADTLAAIAGSMAEAYFGVPTEMKEKAMSYLNTNLTKLLLNIEEYIK